MKGRLSVCLILSLLFSACQKSQEQEGSGESPSEVTSIFGNSVSEQKYLAELLAFRAEKDSFLKGSRQSPLRKEDRKTFRGLNYYEPNFHFVARTSLQRNENPQPISITTTTGTSRKAVKYGYLEFELSGQTHRLSVYKFTDRRSLAEANYLFVAFTDSTSGDETYGAGRYLDLEENATGQYILDFNRAYNPYCAYNEDFSCPIPPRENRLTIGITAGEKIFH